MSNTPSEILKKSEKVLFDNTDLNHGVVEYITAKQLLTSLTIKLLESEIERKKIQRVDMSTQHYKFGREEDEKKSTHFIHNKLIDADVAFLESQLSEIKKI